MAEYGFTNHARDMLRERSISEEWVGRAVCSPDAEEPMNDGTVHCLKVIPEHGNRTLRVVVNRQMSPNVVVTVFFDRRIRRKK